MTVADEARAPHPPSTGRWFGPLWPLPRWPLRITAAAVIYTFYVALSADFWPYVFLSYNSDALFVNLSFLGLAVWAVVRVLKPIVSGKRRALAICLAIADIRLAIAVLQQLQTVTIGVFAAHLALFHPCAKFGPKTKLGDCVDRNGGTQGTFVLFDRDDELLRPREKIDLQWMTDFDTIAFGHDLSACQRVATLGRHIFLVHCG